MRTRFSGDIPGIDEDDLAGNQLRNGGTGGFWETDGRDADAGRGRVFRPDVEFVPDGEFTGVFPDGLCGSVAEDGSIHS